MGRLFSALTILFLSAFMVFRPEDVPDNWNPFSPLVLDAAPTPVTRWKVRTLGASSSACQRALARSQARATFPPDHEQSDSCHIRGHTRLAGLSAASLVPVGTTCGIAARLYLWEAHDLQPAARRLLGAGIARVHHFDSFSCRRIRTASGVGARMSQHATANAIDIAGFTLTDGRTVSVLRHWPGEGPEAAFLRAARDGLCRWFNLVLSPDYNTLHANHFHADMGSWSGCR